MFFANSYPWKNYVLGQPNIFFFLSNNKIYAFNIGTLSEAVLIDGDVENYTITGMDCTEIKDPQGVEDTYVQLTVTVKDRGLAGKSGGIRGQKRHCHVRRAAAANRHCACACQ